MKKMSIGIGTLSMMMMFVVLCITIFATLALITVDREVKLTNHTLESLSNFYQADGEAERILAQIDAALVSGDAFPSTVQTERKGEGWHISYGVSIDGGQVLEVELNARPYTGQGVARYEILKWEIRVLDEWEYEQDEPFFQELIIGE